MPTVNLSPYGSQQAALDRRRRMAQALSQEAITPIEMPDYPGAKMSAYQGLAKILSGVFGGLSERKLEKEQRELDTQVQADRTSKAQELAAALIGAPQDRTIQLAMAQPQMMGGAVSDATPEGSRALTLPPSFDQMNEQDSRRRALAEALASTDPMQQQFAQAQMGDIFAQQKEKRSADSQTTLAKLQAALQAQDPLRQAQA